MARRVPLALLVANLAVLALYPLAWTAPLMRAGWLPFFEGEAISLLSGIRGLWGSDPALAVLVALFALVLPVVKALALALVQAGRLGGRALPFVELAGRLSMADVFLVALYIVAVKGVGLGHVETAWGLWLFTALVLASLGLGFATARALAREGR